MQGVLVKPITLEALQRLLTRITNGQPPVADHQARPAHVIANDANPPLQVNPKMQALFVQTMQADLDSLRDAINAADPGRVAQVLHRIRGALVIVGAPALVDSGLHIEQRIAQGDGLAALAGPLDGFQHGLLRLLAPLLDDAMPSSPDDTTPP